jgi:hypothetical protein
MAPILRMDPTPVSLMAGQTTILEVAVERRERPGPIHLRLEDLPPSVTAGPDQPGLLEDHFRIALTAHPEAEDAETEVKVVASGTGWQVEEPFTLTVKRVPRFRLPAELPPVTLIPGRPQVVEVPVDRQGFVGVIQFQIDPNELPEGVVAQPATLADGRDRARITLVATDKAPRRMREVHLRVTAAGQSAIAAFRITVRDVPSLSLILDPKVVTVQPGKAQLVTVTVQRSGWEGPAQLQVNNLPPGVQVKPPLPALAADQEPARLELMVAPDAVEVTQEVRVLVRAGDLEATDSLVVTVKRPPAPAPPRLIGLLKTLLTDDVILALAVDSKNKRALFAGGGKVVNGEIVGGRDFAVSSLDCTSGRVTPMIPLTAPRQRGLANVRPGERDRVHCLALAPAGDLVVSGHADGSLRLWDPKTLKEIKPQGMPCHFWTEHKSPVMSVAFSPDGKSIVSGDKNGVIVWWSVKDRKAQATRTWQSFITAFGLFRRHSALLRRRQPREDLEMRINKT